VKPSRACILWLLSCLLLAATAAAEWPYLTEEAANRPEGSYSLSLGVGRTDRRREASFYNLELLTPPKGEYWALPQLQGTLGVGSRAEVAFDYELLRYQPHGGGETSWESGDLRLWTKVGLLRGVRQALSAQVGVKLPNSARLGTNETDFFATALYDLRLAGWVTTLNAGLGVLGNPARERNQDDVFTWGASLRREGSGDGLRCGVETAGQNGPQGRDRQRDGRLYAGVLGWQWGAWRLDGTLRYGIHDWLGWGWLAGVSYER